MRLRRPAAAPMADDGFTLVELMVSLTVLAVGVISVVGVMHSSFRVAGAARSRARAVAVATREIGGLRAVPWASLPVSDGVTRSEVVVGDGRSPPTAVAAVPATPAPRPAPDQPRMPYPARTAAASGKTVESAAMTSPLPVTR